MRNDRRNWRGITVGATAAVAVFALLIQLRREDEPDLRITFLGFTNTTRRGISNEVVVIPRLVFAVSNASQYQVSIAAFKQLYPIPVHPSREDSYLMPATFLIDPGDTAIERRTFRPDPPPWQFDLAYSSPGLKGRIIHGLGGRSTFLGGSIGSVADVLWPTQKLRWTRSEWIGGTNDAAWVAMLEQARIASKTPLRGYVSTNMLLKYLGVQPVNR